MKIFIIGTTNSGKSTLAKYISNILNAPIISAGAWMKKNYYQAVEETKENYTKMLTRTSMGFLQKNPNFFLEKIQDEVQKNIYSSVIIIEGIRNPRDFIHLFNPNEDVVILVNSVINEIKEYPEFEIKGLEIIDELIKYFKLISEIPVFHYSISGPTVEDSISKKLYEYINSIDKNKS